MSKKVIRQHNMITEARYHMSVLEKDVVYMLLSQLKDDDIPGKTYAIKANDLQNLVDKRIDHVHFSKTAKSLVNTLIYTHYKNGETLQFNFLSSGKYKKGKGTIHLELSREVRTFLFALKNNFTQLSLKVALSLRGKHTKRIYEMLSQYKDTGIFTISIDDLKERLWIADKKMGVDKYPKYGLFRSKVLDPAKKELNEKAEFTFDYSETKTGRKYTHLVFSIKKVQANILASNEPKEKIKTNNVLYDRLVDRYKLSSWQAKKISDEVSSSEINKTLYEIQIEVANNKVHNIGGYTASIFDKKYGLRLIKR